MTEGASLAIGTRSADHPPIRGRLPGGADRPSIHLRRAGGCEAGTPPLTDSHPAWAGHTRGAHAKTRHTDTTAVKSNSAARRSAARGGPGSGTYNGTRLATSLTSGGRRCRRLPCRCADPNTRRGGLRAAGGRERRGTPVSITTLRTWIKHQMLQQAASHGTGGRAGGCVRAARRGRLRQGTVVCSRCCTTRRQATHLSPSVGRQVLSTRWRGPKGGLADLGRQGPQPSSPVILGCN